MIEPSDIGYVLPEITVLGTALALLLWAAITRGDRRWTSVSIALTGNGLASLFMFMRAPADDAAVQVFAGQLVVDGYSTFFRTLFLILASLAIVFGAQRFSTAPLTDFAALLQFSLLGMMLLVGAADWATAFIAIETMAIPVYVLVGLTRFRRESLEAAMKYFALGAFASAILVYGIAWTYGLTGTTSLAETAARLTAHGEAPWILFALGLVLVAMGFKVAAVPFHAWTPDAYQGAPTPAAAFISVGPKVAAMALLARIVTLAFEPLAANIAIALAVIAAATMILGNLAAIAQSDVKRLLGYSSIAHTGYMLVGLAAVSQTEGTATFIGIPSVLFYGFVYAFMTFGAFAVAYVVETQTGSNDIAAFRGLAQRAPLPAVAMAVFMLSLTGVPPLSGFLGKLYILQSAVDAEFGWLAVVLVVTSVVSAFYYLRVVVMMFMQDADESVPAEAGSVPASAIVADTHSAVIAATAGATVAFGIVGGGLLTWAQSAVNNGLL
ncbi:MAG: NADH-quinone oxidoreductase subunit N [Chloroflexi bacterium]|nr:NADH-quinone oxidoreductase subunit N [Chloroflexota bacterium]